MKQTSTQGEPNLVNDPIEVSSDTTSSLPGTLSLPSTSSLYQTPTTSFPPKFPINLDDRYEEFLANIVPYD